MKKTYMTPELRTVFLQQREQLLVGSNTSVWGGQLGSRRGTTFFDEEDIEEEL